jgi:[ribosomal protein S5]-alanine N-acetyltransferase
MREQPLLETPRLLLRPFRADDAPAVQALAGARAVADTTLHIPHPYPDGAAEAWIETHAPGWAAGRLASYAIVDAADGALRGAVALAVAPEHARAELGYWIGVPWWGRGLATEAARALVGFGFAGLALHRVQARHLTRNPASGRVMQKLGMRLEGVHREAFQRWGRFEDSAMYAVLAREWGPGGDAR